LNSIGSTVRMEPAVFAWQSNDPTVKLVKGDNGTDGLFWLGFKVTDNGDDTWTYEYALYNLNSHRSAGSFSVPVPDNVTLTNVGFNDPDYHSGEPNQMINNDDAANDWAWTHSGGRVTWTTDAWTSANDRSANALRWSTLHNFRFTTDTPPVVAGSAAPEKVKLAYFRPGSPTELEFNGIFVPDAAPQGGLCPGLVANPPSTCPQCDIQDSGGGAGNGVVDGLDLAIMRNSANFGLCTGLDAGCQDEPFAADPCADANGNGRVEGLDIAGCASSTCFGL
jgi:hypothetical protein